MSRRARRLPDRLRGDDRVLVDAKRGNVRRCTVSQKLELANEELASSQVVQKRKDEELREALHTVTQLQRQIEEKDSTIRSLKMPVQTYKSKCRKIEDGLCSNAHHAELEEKMADMHQEMEKMQGVLAAKDAECQARVDEIQQLQAEVKGNDRERRQQALMFHRQIERIEQESKQEKAMAEQNIIREKKKVYGLQDQMAKVQMDMQRCAAEGTRDKGRTNADGQVERNALAIRVQRSRLKKELEQHFQQTYLMDASCTPAADLQLALTGFFSCYPDLLDNVCTELQVFEKVEQTVVRAIETHWSQEICAGIYIHGDFTKAGWQAMVNLMSKEYDMETEEFVRVRLPYGSQLPKFTSLHTLNAFMESASVGKYGLEAVEGGKGAVLNLTSVLKCRLRAILRTGTTLPQTIAVQLVADAAGWRKKPSVKFSKNFTSFVLKVLVPVKRQSQESAAMVGDGVNSQHNSRLGMMYAGKDSYHLMQRFLNAQPEGSTSPSILQQINLISQQGVVLNEGSVPVVKIQWRFGGDLKVLSEIQGLNGAASLSPCTHCECRKCHLHLSKERLETTHSPTRRSLLRCYMMAHMWGDEYGLSEPYQCPGCRKHITEQERHLPLTSAAQKEYPKQHAGQYANQPPLLPVEVWDAVFDVLHAILRSVVNMFFVSVTMNTPSKQKGQEIAAWMAAQLHVECEVTHSQRNATTTKKQGQSWNGQECWAVLGSIEDVLALVFDRDSRAYQTHLDMWDAFISLMAVWYVVDVHNTDHAALADVVDARAAAWLRAFLRVGSAEDITPTMHTIVCHYGDMIRRHGPLLPFSSEGLEAKHQPLKRGGKWRTNRRAAGAKGTAACSTDIMQVTKRDAFTTHIKEIVPSGKGTKKRKRTAERAKVALSEKLQSYQAEAMQQIMGDEDFMDRDE